MLVGDFNLDNERWSLPGRVITCRARQEYELLEELTNDYRLQLLNSPNAITRVQGRGDELCEAVLDLTWASDALVAHEMLWERLLLGGRDHKAIMSTFDSLDDKVRAVQHQREYQQETVCL